MMWVSLILDVIRFATFGLMVPVATTAASVAVSVACSVATTTASFVATRVISRLSAPVFLDPPPPPQVDSSLDSPLDESH